MCNSRAPDFLIRSMSAVMSSAHYAVVHKHYDLSSMLGLCIELEPDGGLSHVLSWHDKVLPIYLFFISPSM